MELIETLLDRYRNDKYSLDILQIRFLLDYFAIENDKLKEDKLELIKKHIKSLENDKNNMLELQKELDRLNGMVDTMTAELEQYKKYYQNERNLLDNYISKDKIKQIIELKEKSNGEFATLPNGINFCISDSYELLEYLKSLLEE